MRSLAFFLIRVFLSVVKEAKPKLLTFLLIVSIFPHFASAKENAAEINSIGKSPIDEVFMIFNSIGRELDKSNAEQKAASANEFELQIYFEKRIDKLGKETLSEIGCDFSEIKSDRNVLIVISKSTNSLEVARNQYAVIDRIVAQAEKDVSYVIPKIVGLFSNGQPINQSYIVDAVNMLSDLEQAHIKLTTDLDQSIPSDAKIWAMVPSECRIARVSAKLVELVYADNMKSLISNNRRFADSSFLLLQHLGRRPDIQRFYLNKIESYARENIIPKQQFALLWDRLSLNDGGQQRFGTQLFISPEGCLAPTGVNTRSITVFESERKKLGLVSLAAYLQKAATAFKVPAC